MKNNWTYLPLTSVPFKRSAEYMEIIPSDPGLSGSIRCFWGSEKPYIKAPGDEPGGIVVPDTCMDIIYHIDHTDNTVTGGFCGISDCSFQAHDDFFIGHQVSTFGIRFYPWGAYVYSEDSLKDTLNGFCDMQAKFRWLDRELRGRLLEINTLAERVRLAEQLFLESAVRIRHNSVVENVIKNMLQNKGASEIGEIAKEAFISTRQLERLFKDCVGITPKKLNNCIRYQFLWNEILRNPEFNMFDAVYKYGYADQSHLIREFKRYHTMDIGKAKAYAMEDVGNIQDIAAP